MSSSKVLLSLHASYSKLTSQLYPPGNHGFVKTYIHRLFSIYLKLLVWIMGVQYLLGHDSFSVCHLKHLRLACYFCGTYFTFTCTFRVPLAHPPFTDPVCATSILCTW